MSIAIHLQAFENKGFSTFERSVVWDVFGRRASPNAEGWELTYHGSKGGILVLDDGELIDGCSVRRPSDNAIRDLFVVAQRVPSAINLDANFFVAKTRFLDGLPDFLVMALPKPPQVVSSADELLERLAQGGSKNP